VIEIGGELQVQGDAHRVGLLEDRDVVSLPHQRLGECDRQHPITQIKAPAARLDVHHHIAPRQHPLDGRLDQIRGPVPLDDRLTGRNGDDRVSEVASG
jgi:hypothetical protein